MENLSIIGSESWVKPVHSGLHCREIAAWFHFRVYNITVFSYFMLGSSDSPKKNLPVFCLESQGPAANNLKAKWMKKMWRLSFQDANIHSLAPSLFTVPPLPLPMPDVSQFRDCITLWKQSKTKCKLQSSGRVQVRIWASNIFLNSFKSVPILTSLSPHF